MVGKDSCSVGSQAYNSDLLVGSEIEPTFIIITNQYKEDINMNMTLVGTPVMYGSLFGRVLGIENGVYSVQLENGAIIEIPLGDPNLTPIDSLDKLNELYQKAVQGASQESKVANQDKEEDHMNDVLMKLKSVTGETKAEAQNTREENASMKTMVIESKNVVAEEAKSQEVAVNTVELSDEDLLAIVKSDPYLLRIITGKAASLADDIDMIIAARKRGRDHAAAIWEAEALIDAAKNTVWVQDERWYFAPTNPIFVGNGLSITRGSIKVWEPKGKMVLSASVTFQFNWMLELRFNLKQWEGGEPYIEVEQKEVTSKKEWEAIIASETNKKQGDEKADEKNSKEQKVERKFVDAARVVNGTDIDSKDLPELAMQIMTEAALNLMKSADKDNKANAKKRLAEALEGLRSGTVARRFSNR